MLVLLIIFMVTAPLMTSGRVGRPAEDLRPAAQHRQPAADASASTPQGAIFLQDEPVDLTDLVAKLQAIAAEQSGPAHLRARRQGEHLRPDHAGDGHHHRRAASPRWRCSPNSRRCRPAVPPAQHPRRAPGRAPPSRQRGLPPPLQPRAVPGRVEGRTGARVGEPAGMIRGRRCALACAAPWPALLPGLRCPLACDAPWPAMPPGLRCPLACDAPWPAMPPGLR